MSVAAGPRFGQPAVGGDPGALTAAVVAEGCIPLLGRFCFAGLEAKSVPQQISGL